jgi:DNA-binding NarL/FixJ family response regulator
MADDDALADQAASPNPHIGLRSVRALRDLAERLEALQVANARKAGWTWQQIAEVLGVSKQAVHKKHHDDR